MSCTDATTAPRPTGSGRAARKVMLAALCLVAAAAAVGLVPAGAHAQGSAPPAFVQGVFGERLVVGGGGFGVQVGGGVRVGNRLVVVVELWGGWGSAGAVGVSDSAGNVYARLVSFRASEGTELSVWSAPVTVGDLTRPVVTVRPSVQASMGVAVLEYSGLSGVAGAGVVDQVATASGTSGALGVASGATGAVGSDSSLALGVYADSGFGVSVSGDAGFVQRVNSSPSDVSDLLVQERLVGVGERPNATARTGPNTTWLMATLVLKPATGAGAPAQLARAAAPAPAPAPGTVARRAPPLPSGRAPAQRSAPAMYCPIAPPTAKVSPT